MFMRLIALFFIFILNTSQASNFDHQHTQLEQILQKHVVVQGPQSLVRYKALKESPKELDAYLSQLSSLSKAEFQSFNEKQKLAFLINAYNAFTLKLIIDHYPVKSIKKIGGWFGNPWKKKFFSLIGRKMHLDHVEHDWIRKSFDEPRIHFALVCAAKSCPPLRNTAYQASSLDQQLEDAAKDFLNDKERNFYDSSKKTLFLSSIFKWYGEDFNKSKQFSNMKTYISSRMNHSNPQELKQYTIQYLKYDWSLNESKN